MTITPTTPVGPESAAAKTGILRMLRRDLAPRPVYDDYVVDDGEKPRLQATRFVGIPLEFLVVIVLAAIVGGGISTHLFGVNWFTIGLPLVLVAAAMIAIFRCIPGARTRLLTAEDLTCRMWVPVTMTNAISVINDVKHLPKGGCATQILAVFDHAGRDKRCLIALQSGEVFAFRRDEEVPVYELYDRLPFWRDQPANGDAEPVFDRAFPSVVRMARELADNRATVDYLRLVLDEQGVEAADSELAFLVAERLGIISSEAGSNSVGLTDAGRVWLWAVARLDGEEMVPNAAEGFQMTFHNERGIVQFGSSSQAAIAYDNATATNSQKYIDDGADEKRVLQELLEYLRRPELLEELDDDSRAIVDDEAAIIAHGIETQGPITDATRRSVRVVRRLVGNLLTGAGGSALFEALKQIAG